MDFYLLFIENYLIGKYMYIYIILSIWRPIGRLFNSENFAFHNYSRLQRYAFHGLVLFADWPFLHIIKFLKFRNTLFLHLNQGRHICLIRSYLVFYFQGFSLSHPHKVLFHCQGDILLLWRFILYISKDFIVTILLSRNTRVCVCCGEKNKLKKVKNFGKKC